MRAQRARRCCRSNGIAGEVIVADNDSEDGSPLLAAEAGAVVIHEPERGYGSAYLAGFAAARGRYIVMADADLTYDFEEIPRFVAELDDGADMVIGNRMKNIQPGRDAVAAPLHRQPAAVRVPQPPVPHRRRRRPLRHAGGAPRSCCRSWICAPPGWSSPPRWSSGPPRRSWCMTQFPIEYHPREGESKLSSFRDGWRHLRFLLVHSPNHLFIFPGAVMAVIGWLVELVVVAQLGMFGRNWDIHALIAGALLAIVGTQVMALGICAHAYGTYFMGERDRWFDRMRARYTLEHGLLLGGPPISRLFSPWASRIARCGRPSR